MRYFKALFIHVVACFTVVAFLSLTVWAGDTDRPYSRKYMPTTTEILKNKGFFDDPRPYIKEFGPKQILPKAFYDSLTFDQEKMKSLWTELVGFKAPDIVGKIAPEIKPGKYTYKDKDKFPGLKQLMWQDLYNRIKPGGPPHMGCIPEFEIVPTRQYYWALPIAEETKKNLGKTKLDKGGYLIPETWMGGFPFPNPSGEFKGQQIMYNVEKRYNAFEEIFYEHGEINSCNKNLVIDSKGILEGYHNRLAGRCLIEPYGWFDKRAKDLGESAAFNMAFNAPRDIAGMVQSVTHYLDPSKLDQSMLYIPSLRRIRKMTATDSQDPIAGFDVIYDDNEGFKQKLSPTRYPYKFEVIEEREYLLPAVTLDGSEYITSKGMELRNLKFERRPIVVVKLTQLDPTYVYSYRIFYIDKETLNFYHIENYDRKGRLYRTYDVYYTWFPDMGMFSWTGNFPVLRDHVDLHSTIFLPYQLPGKWNRADTSLEGLMKMSR